MPDHARLLEKIPSSAPRGAREAVAATHARVRVPPPAPPAGAGGPPAPGGVGEVRALQRLVGNRAVMRMLDARRPVQALEQDEDEVQRATFSGGEPSAQSIRAAAAEGVRTPSSSLPFLGRIQASFGRHSVDRVQAHTGPGATRASRAMNARAYASGDHVVFGGAPDLRTAAHEAAHVVQQRAGVQLAGGVGRAGDPYERHADAVADAVVAGRSAEALLAPGAGAPPSSARTQEGGTQRSTPVQRMIGEGVEDGTLVVEQESGRFFFTKQNVDGSYTLVPAFGSEGTVIVEAGDEGYDLYNTGQQSSAPKQRRAQKRKRKDRNRFKIRSDQTKRRVFAEAFDEAGEDSGVLHKKARAPKPAKKRKKNEEEEQQQANDEAEGTGDYAYADLAEAYYGAEGLDPEELGGSLAKGALLPLNDGEVPLDPEKNEDLQLIPFLALTYQKFHTPPTLKVKGRTWENDWRQEELDFTRKSFLLGPESVQSILPKLPENRQASRLRDIYPGPIDMGIPPNAQETLLKYNQNKAVYLLNKNMRLDAFRERNKVKDPVERNKRARVIGLESYFKTVAEQEESTARKPVDYVRATLGLKRSDSAESLDLASDDEDSATKIPREIYDPADDLETATRKRNTFLNTLGLTTKQVNRRLLEDALEERLATEGRKRLVRKSDLPRLRKAREERARHQAILDRLEERHEGFLSTLQGPFSTISKADTAYKNKRKMLSKYRPEGSGGKQWEKYDEQLEGYRKKPVGELAKKWQTPLSGVADKTLESKFGAPKKVKGGKKKAKAKPSVSSYGQAADRWAARLGGEAMYGSSDGNNCLIYAIGFALGTNVSKTQAAAIRDSLQGWNLMGVDRSGFLPAYQRVVDAITQHLLSDRLTRSGAAPRAQITIDSVLRGIDPVVIGEAGGIDVRVFHDGIHYWWLKRGS